MAGPPVARLLLASLLVVVPGALRGQQLPDGELGYVEVRAVCRARRAWHTKGL